MTTPYQCEKCGTHFAPDAVGPTPPAIDPEKCSVCGGRLSLRHSAQDPVPDTSRDKWLWFAAFADFWWMPVVLVLSAMGGWMKWG